MINEPPPFESKAMSPNGSPRIICRKCGIFLEPTYFYCPRCGTRQALDSVWYYQPVWIFILAFAALGPFALPLVWLSPQMTRVGKIVMTLAIVFYTVLCFYYGYVLTVLLLKELRNLDGIMRLR